MTGPSSEAVAFLRTIIERPEDDTPRLVFADWLQEHGDEDRATFIRSQCEYARLKVDSREHRTNGGRLELGIGELLDRHRDRWTEDLKLPPNRSLSTRFRRGFVAGVWCTARYFVRHAEHILTATPVEQICFRRLTEKHIDEVVSHPMFRHVHGVEFLTDETPSELVERFFETAPLAHLREITFRTQVVSLITPGWHARKVHLAVAVAGRSDMTNLKRFRLVHLGIGDPGGRALATANFPALEMIDLQGNVFATEVESALRESFGDRLCLGREDLLKFTMAQLDWGRR